MPFSALVPKAMLTLFVCGAEFVVRHLLVIACKPDPVAKAMKILFLQPR